MRYSVIIVICLLSAEACLAQNTATLKTPPLGAVTGMVVQGPSGAPLGKVVVSLSPNSEGVVLEGVGGQRNSTLTAVTESDGHFRIVAVPTGQYSVGLSRDGFVPQTWRSSRQSSMTISVSSGQTISDLTFFMEPACAITGKVVDEGGDAISGVSVTAKSRLGAVYGSDVTNDLGEFRIAGLRKGEYLVLARLMSRRRASTNRAEPQSQTRMLLPTIRERPTSVKL